MITDAYEYGQLIAFTCKNHPHMEWHSKNIAPLGCRKIFYNLWNKLDMGEECDCSMDQLIVKYPNGSDNRD